MFLHYTIILLQLFEQTSIFWIRSIPGKDLHCTRTWPNGFHRNQSTFSPSKTPLRSSEAHCSSRTLETLCLVSSHITSEERVCLAVRLHQDSPFLTHKELHMHGTTETHDVPLTWQKYICSGEESCCTKADRILQLG